MAFALWVFFLPDIPERCFGLEMLTLPLPNLFLLLQKYFLISPRTSSMTSLSSFKLTINGVRLVDKIGSSFLVF